MNKYIRSQQQKQGCKFTYRYVSLDKSEIQKALAYCHLKYTFLKQID